MKNKTVSDEIPFRKKESDDKNAILWHTLTDPRVTVNFHERQLSLCYSIRNPETFTKFQRTYLISD